MFVPVLSSWVKALYSKVGLLIISIKGLLMCNLSFYFRITAFRKAQGRILLSFDLSWRSKCYHIAYIGSCYLIGSFWQITYIPFGITYTITIGKGIGQCEDTPWDCSRGVYDPISICIFYNLYFFNSAPCFFYYFQRAIRSLSSGYIFATSHFKYLYFCFYLC